MTVPVEGEEAVILLVVGVGVVEQVVVMERKEEQHLVLESKHVFMWLRFFVFLVTLQ